MNATILADSFIPTFVPEETISVRLHFEFEDERRKMTSDEFWEFCAQNRKIRAELTKEGDVIIMPPTGSETGDRNAEITMQLRFWAKKDKQGKSYDSSTGFKLPNGAILSPDASWVRKERLKTFTAKQREKFLPLCPDFVLELRSASDSLKDSQEKMAEYMENGARLGWLIDPKAKKVHVYRSNEKARILDNPKTVSGEDVLVGFELDLTEIW